MERPPWKVCRPRAVWNLCFMPARQDVSWDVSKSQLFYYTKHYSVTYVIWFSLVLFDVIYLCISLEYLVWYFLFYFVVFHHILIWDSTSIKDRWQFWQQRPITKAVLFQSCKLLYYETAIEFIIHISTRLWNN